MSQASLFFRVFDLAFFAPGLVVLLPVWLVLRGIGTSDKLDLNGVMAIGAWILMAYAAGLTVHGLGRLLSAAERVIRREADEAAADEAERAQTDGASEAAAPAGPLRRKPSIWLILLGMVALLGVIGVGVGMLPCTPALALLISGAAVLLGRQVGRLLNPRELHAVSLQRSMSTPFDRDKQQELGLYFWYLRATCMNVAVAVPISLTTWLATTGVIEAACVAAGSALPRTPPIVFGFHTTLHLEAVGVAVASVIGFVLAVAGGEYHRAWKQARVALVESRDRAHEQAVVIARINKP